MGSFTKLFGGHCSCCDKSRKRAERLEDELFAEIDSNRRIQDDLVNAVLEAAQVTKRIGARRELARQPEPPPEPDPDTEEFLISEKEIADIADQFVRDAENNGLRYSEDARVLLVEAIRKDPLKYTR